MKVRLVSLALLFYLSATQLFGQDLQRPRALIIGDDEMNNYTVMFPFGWSATGKFSFLHQNMNGLSEAENYIYNFHIFEASHKELYTVKALGRDRISKAPDEDDSLFTAGYDTLTSSPNTYNSAVLDYLIWPQWSSHLKKRNKDANIHFEPTIYHPFSGGKAAGFSFSETQTFAGEDRCMASYEIVYRNESLLNIKGKFDQDSLGIDPYGNSVFYNSYQLMGLFESPYSKNKNGPFFMVIMQSTEGHEEPWEHLYLLGFDPN